MIIIASEELVQSFSIYAALFMSLNRQGNGYLKCQFSSYYSQIKLKMDNHMNQFKISCAVIFKIFIITEDYKPKNATSDRTTSPQIFTRKL